MFLPNVCTLKASRTSVTVVYTNYLLELRKSGNITNTMYGLLDIQLTSNYGMGIFLGSCKLTSTIH